MRKDRRVCSEKIDRPLGHDVVRVSEILPPQASDETSVSRADEDGRIVLTQDLDFSAIIALTGQQSPALGAGALPLIVAQVGEILLEPIAFVCRRRRERSHDHRRQLRALPHGAQPVGPFEMRQLRIYQGTRITQPVAVLFQVPEFVNWLCPKKTSIVISGKVAAERSP